MGFKERGITIGDILITLIIIIATTVLIKTFNKDKRSTFYQNNQETIFYNENSLQKNYLKDLSA